jgi:glycosyltransferase involved in cell wall biosynthesis
MRVLYLIDSLVPGGAERSLAALAPAYAERGIALDVGYLHDRPGLHGELRAAGASLFSLAGPGGRVGWVRRTQRLLRARRPRLVHTTLIEADLVGRFAARGVGIPVVSSLVNPQYGPEHVDHPGFAPWKVHTARIVDRATAGWVARFHAITRYIAQVMGTRLAVEGRRIDVIPRGRDPASLGRRTSARRRAGRRGLGITDEAPLVLAVARQDRQKGLDVLLRALPLVARRAPDATVVVAGREGNETARLRRLVEGLALADRVRFCGPRDDVPNLLCAADVFVLPSRWEGLGSVLLEAMALEAPIVASDLPAVREVLRPGRDAVLVPPDAPEPLGEALAEAILDRRGGAARARAALDRFRERFTIDRVADQMVAFYGRALEAGS